MENSMVQICLLALVLSSELSNVLSLATYPVPGSYYSVLLRYNMRGKTRKVARIAPSPHRLWAYFDPPATLGALPFESIDNTIGRHMRDRERSGYHPSNIEEEINAKINLKSIKRSRNNVEGETTNKQSKLETNLPKPITENPATDTEINASKKNESFEKKKTTKVQKLGNINLSEKKNKPKRFWRTRNSHQQNFNGSCGGQILVSLKPSRSESRKQNRFFHTTIKTIGFPDTYEAGKHCYWNIEVSNECQMGMIVHEIHEGNLLQTHQCSADSVQFVFNGQERQKLCGELRGNVDSYKWTKSLKQNLKIIFNTKPREADLLPERSWGFKMSFSVYCWVHSPAIFSKSKQKMKQEQKKTSERQPTNPDENQTTSSKPSTWTVNSSTVPENFNTSQKTLQDQESEGSYPVNGSTSINTENVLNMNVLSKSQINQTNSTKLKNNETEIESETDQAYTEVISQMQTEISSNTDSTIYPDSGTDSSGIDPTTDIYFNDEDTTDTNALAYETKTANFENEKSTTSFLSKETFTMNSETKQTTIFPLFEKYETNGINLDFTDEPNQTK